MKKILWIVNVALPEACQLMGLPKPVIGGWLYSYLELMDSHCAGQLHIDIISPYAGNQPQRLVGQRHTHYLFPQAWNNDDRLNLWFKNIYQEVSPDIVHIHGSEFPHALRWVESCGMTHTVVSIQGLVSVYARYYMAGLDAADVRYTHSFNDWRFNRTLPQERQRYVERGKSELALLRQVPAVAGRTTWDKMHCLTHNPSVRYFVCQEMLRQPFYQTQWTPEGCQSHRIFLSQSHYPIKGLHKFLEALPLIIRRYPDTQVYIVGKDITAGRWYQRSTYGNILRRLINQYQLQEHLHFLGSLDADAMAEQYRLAHVFVCPSAIENSSNSVCEAQLVGTPVVASYVGGLMDLIDDRRSGLLYRFEETEMLAAFVCEIFDDSSLAQHLSDGARQKAIERHDPQSIAKQLLTIYQNI